MIKMNTYVYCVDNSGVAYAKVFQILGENKKRRVGTIGDRVYVVIKSLDSILFNLLEEKKKKKFMVGTIHRAIIVQIKKKFKREDKTWMWFNSNSIVLVDKKGKPLARRIRTAIPREVAMKHPTIASISSLIV
jgi:large subunit ribosomal protein L14